MPRGVKRAAAEAKRRKSVRWGALALVLAGGFLVAFMGAGTATGLGCEPDCGTIPVDTTPASWQVSVTNTTGHGTVSSDPQGINCGATCEASFDEGSDVTLSAAAAFGYSFAGWGGECSGTGECAWGAIDGDHSVTAGFTNPPPTVDVSWIEGTVIQQGTGMLATVGDNTQVTRLVLKIKDAGDLTGATEVVIDDDHSSDGSWGLLMWDPDSVSNGPKTLTATAYDETGQATSDSANFTIDTHGPTVTVTSGPNGQSFRGGSTQTWNFTVTDDGTGVDAVECSLTLSSAPASFGACSGGTASHSVTGLPQGAYKLMVRGIDYAGWSVTVSRTFRIDTTRPNTKLLTHPAATTASRRARFTFRSSEPVGAKFSCRLDGKAWASCKSPKTYSTLRRGRHTVLIRAIDAAGNVDATPARFSWRVL
jgi:List-Bact-rpt repeat protein